MHVLRILHPRKVVFGLFSFVYIFGVSPEVQTHDKISCATSQLSLPAEFGGLNLPSLALDDEPTHYKLHSTRVSQVLLCLNYESESRGPFYGIIRHELQNVDACTSARHLWRYSCARLTPRPPVRVGF
jgi:hypothetical protein